MVSTPPSQAAAGQLLGSSLERARIWFGLPIHACGPQAGPLAQNPKEAKNPKSSETAFCVIEMEGCHKSYVTVSGLDS